MRWIKLGLVLSVTLLSMTYVYGAKLALVIDDFGYRQANEQKVIDLSSNITVAVLPNAPNTKKIARLANQNGNDIIIHLPMAPFGNQPLEVDTLSPDMDELQIKRIIEQAITRVPYAIGINNHMGSLMTSDLDAMKKVMKVLSKHHLFFLDSRTIARSQGVHAAILYRLPYVERDVFLDDSMAEQDIAKQFDIAVQQARQKGYAVAIGHPYASTVKVLTEKIRQLPDDIELVKVSTLTQIPNPVNLQSVIDKSHFYLEQGRFEWMIFKQATQQE